MKITTAFLLVFCLHASARINGQNLTLSATNSPLEKVFREIKKQTGYTFVYRESLILKAQKVTIKIANAPLEQVLALCFENQPFTYTILNKMIVIKEKEGPPVPVKKDSMPVPVYTITGKIQGNNGEALAGASIAEKGAGNMVRSGDDGSFTITVKNEKAILVVTFVGYESREIPISGRTTINIILTQATSSLNDVVVVGYGTQKRKDLTGSVASVSSKSIKDLGAPRVDQALIGKVAGVQVKPVSGEPGSAPSIRIRGIGSISAGSSPLYVVDGFPTSNIETLNPNDIESLDILKDASATAIYGSRGSNGVIIINTKRGKAGAPTVSFDTYQGWQKAAKRPKFMNALEQATYYKDGIRNRNIDEGRDVSGPVTGWFRAVPQEALDVLSGANKYDADALDAVLRTAPQQQYQLTATGGSENVKYSLSGEYLNQDGIVINSNFKRYSFRGNFDARLSKRLNVKVNVNPSFTGSNNITAAGAGTGPNDGVIAQAMMVNPWYKLLNPDGTYFAFNALAGSSNLTNPLALAREVKGSQNAIRLLGNVSAEYEILKELKLNVLLGTNVMSVKSSRFKPSLPAFFNDPATGSDSSNMLTNWLAEYTLNYTKSFGKHNFSALGGFTTQKEDFKSSSLTSNKYPNNLVPYLSAVSGQITGGTSDAYQWSLISYLGRINYNYDSKYYVTASIRSDGSSRFGSNRKYGVFPSFALAWRISDEKFLKDLSYLSELKLRGSYGQTGNNNIGNYDQYATINYERYDLGGAAIGGYSPGRIANPGLTWEKQKQVNLGLDLSLFQRRVSLTVDHFSSTNTDLLLSVNVPMTTGFNKALTNIGEVKNTGWEFTLNTVNLAGKFEWSTDFNISFFKNKVTKLGPEGDPIYSGGNVTMIGQPIGMFYGYINDGVFKNQAELDKGPIYAPGTAIKSRVGDSRFRDVSGPNGKPDGVINSADQTIMGSPYPDFYYGMSNRFAYKNWSLNVSLQGSQGNKVLSISRLGTLNTRGRVRQLKSSNAYWKSEADPGDGNVPRPNDAPTGNNRDPWNSRYLDYGTYLRINSMTLGYVVPSKVYSKLNIHSIRFYCTVTNPFLFTKNESFNPDVSNSEDALTPGIDNNNYPLMKSIAVGLNLSF